MHVDKAFLLLVRDSFPRTEEVIPLLLPAFLPEEASTCRRERAFPYLREVVHVPTSA